MRGRRVTGDEIEHDVAQAPDDVAVDGAGSERDPDRASKRAATAEAPQQRLRHRHLDALRTDRETFEHHVDHAGGAARPMERPLEPHVGGAAGGEAAALDREAVPGGDPIRRRGAELEQLGLDQLPAPMAERREDEPAQRQEERSDRAAHGLTVTAGPSGGQETGATVDGRGVRC